MSKAMHKGQSFVSRSASYSTHASRTGRNLPGWGEAEAMNVVQQRDAALARLRQVQEQLVEMKERKASGRVHNLPAFTAQSKSLKAEHGRLCEFLATIKQGKKKEMRHLAHYVVDVIQERLTKPEWEVLLKEAMRRFDLARCADESTETGETA